MGGIQSLGKFQNRFGGWLNLQILEDTFKNFEIRHSNRLRTINFKNSPNISETDSRTVPHISHSSPVKLEKCTWIALNTVRCLSISPDRFWRRELLLFGSPPSSLVLVGGRATIGSNSSVDSSSTGIDWSAYRTTIIVFLSSSSSSSSSSPYATVVEWRCQRELCSLVETPGRRALFVNELV